MRRQGFVAKLLDAGHTAQVHSAILAEQALQHVDLNPDRQVNTNFVSANGFAQTDLPPGYTGGQINGVQVMLDPVAWNQLIADIQGQYNFQQVGFSVNTAGALIRSAEKRNYFLIQNTSAATIYVGFGTNPTSANGLQILAGGNYEPLKVPQNDVYAASASGTATGVMILATGQG